MAREESLGESRLCVSLRERRENVSGVNGDERSGVGASRTGVRQGVLVLVLCLCVCVCEMDQRDRQDRHIDRQTDRHGKEADR